MGEPLVFDPLAKLVAKAGAGDRSAARALVEAVSPRIWRIAWRLLRDAAEAEDITQEALIRLWAIAPKWKPGRAKIETWLYRVTTHLCFDRLRKAGRFVEEAAGADAVDPSTPPDGGLRATDVCARVDLALSLLPHRQSAAIILTHYDGLSAKAAGEVLDISVEALESLLARARKALRQALADEKHDLLETASEGFVA